MLAANRKSISEHAPNELSRSIGFLHRDYNPRFFWWEVRGRAAGCDEVCEGTDCRRTFLVVPKTPIELLRKLSLTGVPLLIGSSAELARVVLA
eukprot:5890621-Pleurochrysis_carterae.AAC.1